MASLLHDARRAFRLWRRTRPFWGGLLVILGACEILSSEQGPLQLVIHIGIQGLAGYLIPVIMLLCGVLLWFSPAQRSFYSLLSLVLSLGSWVTSNLGGFFLGMMLGLVGGALAFAWATGSAERQPLKWYLGNPEIVHAPGGLELVLRPTPALPAAAHAGEIPAGFRALPSPHPLALVEGSSPNGPTDKTADVTGGGSSSGAAPSPSATDAG